MHANTYCTRMRRRVAVACLASILAACTPAPTAQQPTPGPSAAATTAPPAQPPTLTPPVAATSAATNVPVVHQPTLVPTIAPSVVPTLGPTAVPPPTDVPPMAIAPPTAIALHDGPERIFTSIAAAGHTQLAAIAPDGSNAVALTAPTDDVVDWAVAPDRRRIAVALQRDDHTDIAVITSDGSAAPVTIAQDLLAAGLTWSPDGLRVAFVVGTDATTVDTNEDIYLANADGSAVRQLTTDPLPDRAPVWSPDSTQIAFERGQYAPGIDQERRRVFVVAADGGTAQALTALGSKSFAPAWTADGQYVTLRMAGSRFQVRPDGSQLTAGDVLPAIDTDSDNFDFAPSPDGSQVAFVHQTGVCQVEACTRHIYLAQTDGSAVRQLTVGDTTIRNDDLLNSAPAWSPDGTTLVFRSNRDDTNMLYTMNADGSDQRQLATNAGISGVQWLRLPAAPVSAFPLLWLAPALDVPTGVVAVSTLVAGATTRDIYIFPTNGTPTQVSRSPADDYAPAWSPDGTQLAFISDRDGGPSLYRTNTTGSTLVRLAVGTADAPIGTAAWSPDGRTLVYDHNCVLETVAVDGSNMRVLLAPNDGQDACFSTPSYAPDGQTVIFAATVDASRSAIFTISATGGTATQRTDYENEPGSEQSPVFSPDGTRIAFVSARLGAPHVYVADASGNDLRRLASFVAETDPTWSPDGRFIACTATTQSGTAVYIVPTDALPADAQVVWGLSQRAPGDPIGDNTQPAWRPQ